eukprot:c22967_g1_i1.p1 GENE.c22967_g1_i1~~c22967_g1_i1.p1  ORF type:complete len:650 (+),score=163.62 c22967_g1_i1:106-1950(+)
MTLPKIPSNATIFEIAWEVANKVGGIYTVIASKAGVTVEELGDSYFCIGPLKASAKTDVEMLEPPQGIVRDSITKMRESGMNVVYGRWLIEGNPQVILMDLGSCFHMLNQWKGDLYDAAKISIPDSDLECNDSVIFGAMVAAFIGIYAHLGSDKVFPVAHFHEWQTATSIPLIRKRGIRAATVFTTHATLLGRFLCAGETDFYNNLPNFDVDHEAGHRGIYHRYCIERAACHAAHIFSTVSDITADESEHLLKRKADVVMPNGLHVLDEMHEFQNLHLLAKEKINRFVQGHFYGHGDFDIDKTLYFFTAGRYEFLNKGADVYLESLARLNHMLKEAKSDTTVVAFLILPAEHNNYNSETLKGQGVGNQLREAVEVVKQKIGRNLFESAIAGVMPTNAQIIDKADLVQLKRSVFAAQRSQLPPVVTHNLQNDTADPILNAIRRLNLFNTHNDRVKVIFHPQFLNKTSPIFPIDYEEFVRGCHLGVFPSYYEPWGYTPAECAVRGIPSITTNLSGFGRFVETILPEILPYFKAQNVTPGVYVVDRRFKSLNESIDQLAHTMLEFCSLSRRERINQRNLIRERVAGYLDWKELGKNYTRARVMALQVAFPQQFSASQ